MSVVIRRFKKEDIEDAKNLMIQLCEATGTEFNEERWLWGIKMRLYDALKRNGMLVATIDDQVAGLLLADINIDPTGVSTGYIRSVIVGADFRQQGVGKKLISEAINYLKNMDVDVILINVRSTTENARQLYESLGFKELYRVMRYPLPKKRIEDMTLPDTYTP